MHLEMSKGSISWARSTQVLQLFRLSKQLQQLLFPRTHALNAPMVSIVSDPNFQIYLISLFRELSSQRVSSLPHLVPLVLTMTISLSHVSSVRGDALCARSTEFAPNIAPMRPARIVSPNPLTVSNVRQIRSSCKRAAVSSVDPVA